MMSDVVVVQSVTKIIRESLILDDVNLAVPDKSICGITGHNGSGKSMLLRMITGLVKATRGEIWVFGKRIGGDVEFAPETGALIDMPGLLLNYSALKNLQLLAMIQHKITTVEIVETLRQVGLDPNDKRPVRTYSTGMRQRLGIAQAIMEKPKLLILDEPTRGIDDEGVHHIHQLLKEMRDRGTTILLTSHIGDELQTFCDFTYTMKSGKLTKKLSLVDSD